jgi:hypothetical protein
MGDASVFVTKALACSERAAGLAARQPPPGRSIHVRAPGVDGISAGADAVADRDAQRREGRP